MVLFSKSTLSNDETDQALTNIIGDIKPSIENNIKLVDPENFLDLKNKIFEKINSIFDNYNTADLLSDIEDENIDISVDNNPEGLDDKLQSQNDPISSDPEFPPIKNDGNGTLLSMLIIAAVIILLITIYYVILFAVQKKQDPIKRNIKRPNKENRIKDEVDKNLEDKIEVETSETLHEEQPYIPESVEPKNYGKALLNNKNIFPNEMEFTIFTEKVSSKGEDANPILGKINDDETLISVFDGLGGAGGTTLTTLTGEQNSHAYYGSRIVHDFFINMCNDGNRELLHDPKKLKQELHVQLDSELRDFKSAEAMMISKKPTKLPTTLAAMLISTKDHPTVEVQSLWAGDSRCYALTAANGLEYHSIDDIRSNSPEEFISTDAPMTNYINAEGKFIINSKKFMTKLPSVFIVATDGCFGYFPSPMHFEYILLKTLEDSNSMHAWQAKLKDEIVSVTQDDATLALISIGWKNFADLKKDFMGKAIKIYEQFISPNESFQKDIEKIKYDLEQKQSTYKAEVKKGISDYIKNRIKS